MTIRLYQVNSPDGKTRDPLPGDRCAIGRHRIDHRSNNMALFVVDGKVLCYQHIMEIVKVFDSVRGAPGISAREMIRHHHERDQENAKRAVVTSMQARGGRQPGYVYYIRIDQHIKIGYAANIASRMRAYPPSAILLAAHPGTKETEREMHLEFRRYLDRGREWFSQGEKLMTHISEVLAQFGDPTLLGYEYTKARRSG